MNDEKTSKGNLDRGGLCVYDIDAHTVRADGELLIRRRRPRYLLRLVAAVYIHPDADPKDAPRISL